MQGSLRVTDTTYSTNINLASATASQAVVTDANKNLISKGITDNASSTALGTSDTNLVTARSVANAGYVKSSGVTSVATGAGLTGGTITSTGTIKAYLKSETKATYDSATVTNTSSRQYAITPDNTGYLSVNVPWADTHRVIKVNGTEALASNTTALNLIAGSNVSITDGGSGSVTIAATDTTYSAATTSAAGLMSAADKTKLNASTCVYYCEGPSTDSAGIWTATIDGITEYYNGLTILYVLGVAGKSGSTTLNVNNIGAIQCYNTDKGAIAAITTHYPAGTPILFTYLDNKFVTNDYSRANDNTTSINTLNLGSGAHLANSVIYRYQLLAHVDDDKLTPFNNVSNGYNNTSKAILTNIAFDPFKPFYYYNTTTTINANANVAPGNSIYFGAVDLRYSFNISASVNALTTAKNVYMKVIPQGDWTVKLAAAFPLTQTLPTYDDGYWYIYLGRAYSTYQMQLYSWHPVFYHDGTSVKEVIKPADIRYTTTSTAPSNPQPGTIWLQKKDSTSVSGTNLPNAMFQTVSITIPYNTTSYTYTNSWITNETAIIQTDLAANGMRDTYITWNISTGQIVFTLGATVPRNITFQAAMIK